MLATKKPPGEARSAAILRSASLVKPSMVSVYMVVLCSSEVGCCMVERFADDDEGGCGKAGALGRIRKAAERCEHRTLVLARAVLNDATGRARRKARGQHVPHQFTQAAKPHIDDERRARGCECAPVHRLRRVAGDERHAIGGAAKGERQPEGSGDAQARGDSGYHLDSDAGGLQCGELFATAAEDERITTLESHDRFAGAREADHQLLDEALRRRSAAAALADAHDASAGEMEAALIDQLIDEHHARLAERAHCGE